MTNRCRALAISALAVQVGLITAGAGQGEEPDARHTPGPLVLIGGKEDKEGERGLLREFVRRAGGPRARILVVTYPSRDPTWVERSYRDSFGRIGVAEVRALHLADRRTADDPASVAALRSADGVYFTGGSQWTIVSLLKGSRFGDELHTRWREGLTVGGTSAGATMMPETMLSLGTSADCPRAADAELEPGLGFVRGVLVDSHFSQRGRLGRLLSALSEKPGHVGLGIDEDTGLVLKGDAFEVIGQGAVTVLDGRSLRPPGRPSRKAGEPIAVEGVTLHVLPSGYRYDLKTHTVIPARAGNPDAGATTGAQAPSAGTDRQGLR